ncbi:MAG TPA: ribonuclease H family protein [Steroidobacter sp.]
MAQKFYVVWAGRRTGVFTDWPTTHQQVDRFAGARYKQILCDSTYAINCISKWAAGWEKKGWRKAGGAIKNLEIIQAAYAVYSRIQSEVHLTHVNAHVGGGAGT